MKKGLYKVRTKKSPDEIVIANYYPKQGLFGSCRWQEAVKEEDIISAKSYNPEYYSLSNRLKDIIKIIRT